MKFIAKDFSIWFCGKPLKWTEYSTADGLVVDRRITHIEGHDIVDTHCQQVNYYRRLKEFKGNPLHINKRYKKEAHNAH